MNPGLAVDRALKNWARSKLLLSCALQTVSLFLFLQDSSTAGSKKIKPKDVPGTLLNMVKKLKENQQEVF